MILLHLKNLSSSSLFFSDDIDLIVSDRVQKNNDLSQILQTYYFDTIEQNPLETAIKRVITTCNPLYRKSVVQQLNGYNEQLASAQDWDFHIRLVLAGFKIKYVPGIFFINRKVADSVSSNWIKVSIQAADVILHLKTRLEESPLMNKSIRQYISQIYMDSAIYASAQATTALYIHELFFWSQGDYSFIKNKFKQFWIRIIGIEKMIKIRKKFGAGTK
jgi:GT2 family glycosyltransferase